MSPVRHQVSGPALAFSLDDEIETVRRELAGTAGRVARTLVKDGPMRVTLVGVSAGGSLKPHKADGPISVQVLEGAIEMQVEGQAVPLERGALFVLERGVTHAVRSTSGGFFLLTVVGQAT